jgi:hypothetical protein
MPIRLVPLLANFTFNLPRNDRVYGPFALEQGVGNIEIDLSIENWGPSRTVTVTTEVSFNGGATWEPNSVETLTNPPTVDKAGLPLTITSMTWSIWDEQNANRQIRVHTSQTGNPFQTTITMRSRTVT